MSVQIELKQAETQINVRPCDRCGDFIEQSSDRNVLRKSVCDRCQVGGTESARDVLEHYQGKRDGFVMLFGVGGMLVGALALYLRPTIISMPAAMRLAINGYFSMMIALGAAYFLRFAWARYAILFFPLFHCVVAAMNFPNRSSVFFHTFFALVQLVIILGQLFNTRNKLAFSLPISDEELGAFYYGAQQTRLTETPIKYAFIGIIIPVFSALAIREVFVCPDMSPK